MRQIILLLIMITMMGLNSRAEAFLVWQIGTFDGIMGSNEFEAGSGFYDVYNYNVNTNPDNEINSPNFPGYLFTNALSTIDPYRPQTVTAQNINIYFNLDQDYNNVVLRYDRYGSELNDVFLDDSFITSITGPGENKFQSFSIDLGDLLSGDHTISLRYANGGVDNGNYIDALNLGANPVPEPSTMLLFSANLGIMLAAWLRNVYLT